MKNNKCRCYENYILLEISFSEKDYITKYVNNFKIRNNLLIIGFWEDNTFFEESIPMNIVKGLLYEDWGDGYAK